MKIKLKYFDMEIEFLFLIVIFISIFSVKFRNLMSYFYLCYLFIIFHELSHIFIGSLLGKSLEKIHFCMSGVNAKFFDKRFKTTKNINYFFELLVNSAGPISNLILASIFYKIDIIFEINIFLAIINLIPIYPLDGFNILKNIINLLKINNKNVNNISNVSRNILVIIAVFQILYEKTISLLIFCIYLYIINLNCRKNYSKFVK